ncbi:hypothetical protein [Candidatus Anaplasma sp. TIGMIC]|uniref:hypothetical protein n=1 Tax=Candidatus Anaplasma sp. TIGMIC TaxID=3020713 RepID=UPI00232CCF95|nr:hypothetical protein [Candidatus Anaplasma sp. TIGMIC]MDB1135071.1 hypothetical protein [Candidatus Anaplasma sp. TIGMIC]
MNGINEVTMPEQHPNEGNSVLIRNRLRSLTVISEMLRKSTVTNDMRRTEEDRVRDGRATIADLYCSAIYINGLPIETSGVSTQFGAMSSRNKNQYFPIKDICGLVGIAVSDYQQNLDPYYARRDAFCQIKLLMEIARHRNLGVVAHPLLIEELVTTLNTYSMVSFPFSTVLASGEPRSPSYDAGEDKAVPPKQGIYIRCIDERKISVYSHLYPLNWVDGKVAAHLRYDITVADDEKSIRYENVRTLLAFPGGKSEDIDACVHDELGEFGFPPVGSTLSSRRRFADAFEEAPGTYPVDTFFLSINTPDESISARSMYSAPLQHTTPADASISSDVGDIEDVEDYIGRSSGIKRFFKRMSNGMVSMFKFISSPFQKAFSVIASGVTRMFEALKKMFFTSDRYSSDSEKMVPDTAQRSPTDSSISQAGSSSIHLNAQAPEVISSDTRTTADVANSATPGSITDGVDITASTANSQRK